MAVEDSNSPHGLRLLIQDYPFAIDGLEIWSAIKTWVRDYCSFYYKTDKMVQKDYEVQSWWEAVLEKGHGDKRHEPWWPKMNTRNELVESCTTIIWVAFSLHAAMNFRQYPYGGYPPNQPAMNRRLLPKHDTPDYDELEHSSDEVFLGQRDTAEWTTDMEAIKAIGRFEKKLEEIEKIIDEMSGDKKRWRNKVGLANMPYA
ncbi:hypothetical protein LguiB_021035 [Lonicera macranthoides]